MILVLQMRNVTHPVGSTPPPIINYVTAKSYFQFLTPTHRGLSQRQNYGHSFVLLGAAKKGLRQTKTSAVSLSFFKTPLNSVDGKVLGANA
jgi:hypothetical protein